MKVQLYKDLGDRAHYFVSSDEFFPAFESNVPYANDARPLRYLGPAEQPGGTFHLYEGSSVELRRVKRIEQDPVQVAAMFEDYLATFMTVVSRVAYANLPLSRYSDKGVLYRQYNEAMDEKPPKLALAADRLRQLSKLYDKEPVTSLPFVKAVPDADTKTDEEVKVESKVEKQTEPDDERASVPVPWVPIIVVVATMAVLVGASENGR